MITRNLLAIAFFYTLSLSVMADEVRFDPEEDETYLGAREDFKFWPLREAVASYRNFEHIFPTRTICASGSPLRLVVEPIELEAVQIETESSKFSLDEYFDKKRVAGLLVIKNGKIVYERYGLGNTRDSRWVSFSISKSVVSLLIGVAIKDGYIESVNEKITDYLPRLEGSPYAENSIRDLLQMASGVPWTENYSDPDAEVNRVPRQTLSIMAYMTTKERGAAPGQVFNYNSAESDILSTLLRAAIGNNLSSYLQNKIWRPFGMEGDANWYLNEPFGGERGACCISATLRDYGRLGLFVLGEGRLPDGRRAFHKEWIEDSLNPSKARRDYGYLWWLYEDGGFGAAGIFGQGIYINPEKQVVIALHSARETNSSEDWELQRALYRALTNAVE